MNANFTGDDKFEMTFRSGVQGLPAFVILTCSSWSEMCRGSVERGEGFAGSDVVDGLREHCILGLAAL